VREACLQERLRARDLEVATNSETYSSAAQDAKRAAAAAAGELDRAHAMAREARAEAAVEKAALQEQLQQVHMLAAEREAQAAERFERASADAGRTLQREREQAQERHLAVVAQMEALRAKLDQVRSEAERAAAEAAAAYEVKLQTTVERSSVAIDRLSEELGHARAQAAAVLKESKVAYDSKLSLVESEKQRQLAAAEMRVESLQANGRAAAEKVHENTKQLLREQAAAIRSERHAMGEQLAAARARTEELERALMSQPSDVQRVEAASMGDVASPPDDEVWRELTELRNKQQAVGVQHAAALASKRRAVAQQMDTREIEAKDLEYARLLDVRSVASHRGSTGGGNACTTARRSQAGVTTEWGRRSVLSLSPTSKTESPSGSHAEVNSRAEAAHVERVGRDATSAASLGIVSAGLSSASVSLLRRAALQTPATPCYQHDPER